MYIRFPTYILFTANDSIKFIGTAPRFNLTYFMPLIEVSSTSTSDGWKCKLHTYMPEKVSIFNACTHFLPISVVWDGILWHWNDKCDKILWWPGRVHLLKLNFYLLEKVHVWTFCGRIVVVFTWSNSTFANFHRHLCTLHGVLRENILGCF